MATVFKKMASPSFLFFACVIVVSALVGILSEPYFTEPVFYIDGHKYALDRDQGALVAYRSGSASPVQVRIDGPSRTVIIDRQEHVIAKNSDPYNIKYSVTYPNGRRYEVQDQSRLLLSYDAKGDLYLPFTVSVNGQSVKGDDEEAYSPAALVTAAYPEYHEKPGVPGFLFLALGLLIYGWCSYRYRKFQDVTFWLSLKWIWVEDPEPSEFYYFMCKVGGILVMFGAVWVAFQAY
ncbi:hypothetical protein [Cohnella nanjingensis]|uniref:DUF6199 domain-containing protein n=1 Tax=Cohnella nanjingensis TaxID=1387779 RepID=A0A7X0RKE9_9BACL|nr:hypothetical protein [Cohnella nanjingensis]MBB6669107.1 hypothetical protein [Cohnella nanjingensis]